jgi:hypothetical protein
MADKKISQLTSATTPVAGTETLPIVQSGSTVKVPINDLTAGRAVPMLSATLSGGTANSVVYLNASKETTSGAALSFNGTNLGVGGSLSTTPSLNKGVYLQSDTNNAVIGYSLHVNDGANNRRGSMFLDDAAGVWGWDVTASSGLPSYSWRLAGSEVMRVTSDSNIVAGASAALATTATNGFLYVPTCAGTPTGTPTAITGMAPIVVNTTNNKLYFYSGGAWRDAGP